MRRLLPTALCALSCLAACAPAQTGSKTSGAAGPAPAPASATSAEYSSRGMAENLLRDSARTLDEMRRDTPKRMLDEAIAGARAVIILPGVYQAGFMYSVHAGSGVLVARRADGGWGAPVFMAVGGAGYGPQVGLEKSRLVLAVMEEEMLERILSQGISIDATAKYDVLGVREETGPGTLTEGRPVMAFSDGVGAMAGVALRGGLIKLDRGLTRSYHGADAGEAESIMRGANAPGMETFALWAALGVTPDPAGEVRGSIVRFARP